MRNRLTFTAFVAGLAVVALVPAVAAPRKPAATPAFRVYVAPGELGNAAGEPTLGINPKTGAVLFQAMLETLKVTDFDRRGKGSAKWANVAPLLTSVRTFDPILEMDPDTGRTWVSQLALACSLMAYTDNDGASWTNVPMGCGAGTLLDHQSVGVARYTKSSPVEPLSTGAYPNAVYYCAQDVVSAKCSISTDGGNTFGPGIPAYTTAQCHFGGVFGHLKSAPDGTLYLPPRYCPDIFAGEFATGVSVSEDNGVTWTVRLIPGSRYGDAGHSNVGVARDGTIYVAYGGGDFPHGGPVYVAKSRDKGRTWSKPMPMGTSLRLQNSRFPVAVAGDGDRAAVTYLGSTTAGDGSAPGFRGRWDLYVSTTYNGGKTWTTVNVTKDNPVQIGAVCTAGTTCGNDRNLLDFNDMVIDKQGRVYVAFADGCTRPKGCGLTDRQDKASIARQVGGRGLLAAYDGKIK